MTANVRIGRKEQDIHEKSEKSGTNMVNWQSREEDKHRKLIGWFEGILRQRKRN